MIACGVSEGAPEGMQHSHKLSERRSDGSCSLGHLIAGLSSFGTLNCCHGSGQSCCGFHWSGGLLRRPLAVLASGTCIYIKAEPTCWAGQGASSQS